MRFTHERKYGVDVLGLVAVLAMFASFSHSPQQPAVLYIVHWISAVHGNNESESRAIVMIGK
jgi:hypothetical protein